MHPAKWDALLGSGITSAATYIEPGAIPRFCGYRVIVTPSCLIGATQSVVLADPMDQWLATDGQYRVAFDPYTLMTAMLVRVRMTLHADHGVPGPSKVSKAVITA
jgi:hypothetical protein